LQWIKARSPILGSNGNDSGFRKPIDKLRNDNDIDAINEYNFTESEKMEGDPD
jgi:hypothetical protein